MFCPCLALECYGEDCRGEDCRVGHESSLYRIHRSRTQGLEEMTGFAGLLRLPTVFMSRSLRIIYPIEKTKPPQTSCVLRYSTRIGPFGSIFLSQQGKRTRILQDAHLITQQNLGAKNQKLGSLHGIWLTRYTPFAKEVRERVSTHDFIAAQNFGQSSLITSPPPPSNPLMHLETERKKREIYEALRFV